MTVQEEGKNEGNEPEDIQGAAVSGKNQTVSAKASAKGIFGASARHVGSPSRYRKSKWRK